MSNLGRIRMNFLGFLERAERESHGQSVKHQTNGGAK
jgi:hypothetical protein